MVATELAIPMQDSQSIESKVDVYPANPDSIQKDAEIIELHPTPDLLNLTRDVFHSLPDASSKYNVLLALRRRSYDPSYATKFEEVFPESESKTPIHLNEAKVFDVIGRRMNNGHSELSESDREVLGLLHGISPEDAVLAFDEENRIRSSEQKLTVAYAIGDYKMTRQLLYQLDQQIIAEDRLGRSLERDIDYLPGGEAYLPAGVRNFLRVYREEVALRREYEKQHPYQASLSEGDKQVLRNNGSIIH